MHEGTPLLRYSGAAMLLHWVMAAAIFTSLGVGLYMTGLAISPQRLKLYNWHKWAGVVLLSLALLRLALRVAKRPPALPHALRAAMPRWQFAAYQATHYLMYALFVAIPLAGWAYTSATGFPVVVFGLFPLPDLAPKDQALAATLKLVHKYLAYTLASLVVLHVVAALKHQFFDRDGLLLRMLPERFFKPSNPSY